MNITTEITSVSHGTTIAERPSSSPTMGAKATTMMASLSATREPLVQAAKVQPVLGLFEHYLTIWVALCIIAGIALGHWFPAAFKAIGRAEVAQVNLPVAVLIWLMIIPMLLKIDVGGGGCSYSQGDR